MDMKPTGLVRLRVEVDDVVIWFARVEVFGINDLAAQVRIHRPGETVEMTLMRDDVARLARKVADRPSEKPRMPARSAEQKEKDQRDLQNESLLRRSGTHG